MKNQMNGLADQVENKAGHLAREAKTFAKDASSEARAFASDAQGYAEEGLKSIQDTAAMLREQAQVAWKKSDEAVKANPYYFVAGTAVAGLALGYLLGRTRRQ